MERGTYIAASGGLVQLRRLDVVNNNLANVNTPGFKRQILVGDLQQFEDTLASVVAQNDPYAKGDHDRTPGTVNLRTQTDFTPGPIKNTENPLDVALRNPKDFFVVNSPEGPLYTRAGNFTLTPEGELVTVDGFAVQGDGGAITANGPGANITPNGTVLANGLQVGKLQVVRFDDPQVLEPVGATRFRLKAGGVGPQQVEPALAEQSLEMANVSAITSMIDLIIANRGFEMYTKSAQAIDNMNQTAISQIGRNR